MPPGRKALFTFRVRGETVGAITVTSTPGESRVRTSQIGLATEQESTSQARALMITLNNLSIDDAAALFFCVIFLRYNEQRSCENRLPAETKGEVIKSAGFFGGMSENPTIEAKRSNSHGTLRA